MQIILTTLMGMVGAVCFAMLFNVRGYKLISHAIGAMISWIVYMYVFSFNQDKVISLFCATATIGILSEILARLMKAPVIVMLVPMLVPLFPGSDLFYATSYLVRGDNLMGMQYLELVLKEAGAMAFAIIIVTSLTQVVLKVARYLARNLYRVLNKGQ